MSWVALLAAEEAGQPRVPERAPQLPETARAVASSSQSLLGEMAGVGAGRYQRRPQETRPGAILGPVAKGEEVLGLHRLRVITEDDALAVPVHPELRQPRPVAEEVLDRPRDVVDPLRGVDPDAGATADRMDDVEADRFFQHVVVLRYDPLLPDAPATLSEGASAWWSTPG